MGDNVLDNGQVFTAIGNFCICSIAIHMFIELPVIYACQKRLSWRHWWPSCDTQGGIQGNSCKTSLELSFIKLHIHPQGVGSRVVSLKWFFFDVLLVYTSKPFCVSLYKIIRLRKSHLRLCFRYKNIKGPAEQQRKILPNK